MKIHLNEKQETILFSILSEGKHKSYGGTNLEWLKKHEVELTDEEKSLCKERDAVWENGDVGVHKGKCKDDTIVYFSYTHRAWNMDTTIKKGIKTFEFIKSTS